MSETKISQPVLDAHAQFGGDLESMQKLYDYASLSEENRRLREALENIRDGYGPNHLSRWARTIARAALSQGQQP